ncbi:MAG: phage tail protein, partial [Planctomycetota bacterium]
MLVLSQGPATRRPGTKYIATVKTGSPVLLSFDYATDDTYIMETGNLYMRFYRSGGQILSGSDAYEIATPFLEADLFEIQTAQVDNVMYLVDGTNPPQKLTRSGHTSWAIIDAPIESGPFQTENSSTTTITPTGYTLAADQTAETFVISGSGDLSSIFTVGKDFVVGGSTANDGKWTVKSRAYSSPDFTITIIDDQDITSDVDDGTILIVGGAVTLTASAATFDSGHAGNGSYWEINQQRGTNLLSGELSSDDACSVTTASFTGGYSFTTSGTWDATVTLQRSTDDGATWDSALSSLNSTNFDNPAETEADTVLHRVLMTDWVSGTCNYKHTISDT